jgi:hypothetical protein
MAVLMLMMKAMILRLLLYKQLLLPTTALNLVSGTFLDISPNVERNPTKAVSNITGCVQRRQL